MALRIPEEDLPAIATIKALSAASIDELVAAINSAQLTRDLAALAKLITKKVPSIPGERLPLLLDALYTLYYIRELSGVKREVFLEDLIDSIQSNPKVAVANKDISKFRVLLSKLLDIEAFNALSKGGRLQRDGERLYCDAKILSDIRPVFGVKPTSRPVGAVVTHTLKMGYHKGGDHEEFHVILNSEDLLGLNELVARALAKDKTLRDLLAEAKLPDLGA
jgi:hypothetical protein